MHIRLGDIKTDPIVIGDWTQSPVFNNEGPYTLGIGPGSLNCPGDCGCPGSENLPKCQPAGGGPSPAPSPTQPSQNLDWSYGAQGCPIWSKPYGGTACNPGAGTCQQLPQGCISIFELYPVYFLIGGGILAAVALFGGRRR